MNLVHVVLISFNFTTPEKQRREIYDLYQDLARKCGGPEAGILFWQVSKNLDLRKGIHLVEMAIFRDNAALQAFRNHPAHQEIVNILKGIANWYDGDITSNLGQELAEKFMAQTAV